MTALQQKAKALRRQCIHLDVHACAVELVHPASLSIGMCIYPAFTVALGQFALYVQ